MNPTCARALKGTAQPCPKDCVIIHNVIYNIGEFAHPGGRVFLKLSDSIDITALFESSHVNGSLARNVLSTLPIVGNVAPKGAQYDYSKYEQLRQWLFCFMPTRASRSAYSRVPLAVWSVACIVLHCTVLSIQFLSPLWLLMCAISALCNTVMGGFGHNGVHRLHPSAVALDWNGLSCFEWLSEHVVSHHPFVNTEHDHDAISLEPLLTWLPGRDAIFGCAQISPVRHLTYLLSEMIVALQGMFVHGSRWKAVRYEAPMWMVCAPLLFILRIASHILVQDPFVAFASLFVTMSMAGYGFATLAHWSHDIVSESIGGCFVKQQLANTRDIEPLGLTNEWSLFLDRQRAHHLFPTVDHSRWTPQLIETTRKMSPQLPTTR
jgi:hypothetical protein